MTPERWARLTEIFDAAIERPPAERPAFLVAACPEVSLRRDVERLLDSHEHAEQTDFGNSAAFQVTADVTLEAGAHLGRYEVIALLGRGGMGNVYRGRDPLLDREVAIKVLRHRGDITPDDLQRFERETRAAGALHHPNVLAVYDVGTADGAPFVVSELLEGETLRARLARGPLPVTEAADVARQIISGVAAAHDRGIIHRDLKPENLFLTREGIVRILDFGLAKQVVEDLDPDTDPDTDPAEGGGLLMGTAGYMAPEQVVGKEADERSDLFAFGALLYEMLTGSRAFNADSAAETMQAVLTTDPAGLHARAGHLRAIATQWLAKNSADRLTFPPR